MQENNNIEEQLDVLTKEGEEKEGKIQEEPSNDISQDVISEDNTPSIESTSAIENNSSTENAEETAEENAEKEEETESDNTEASAPLEEEIEEETNNFLAAYELDYSDDERKEYWDLISRPMITKGTIILCGILVLLAIIMIFLRHTFAVSASLGALALVFAGVPIATYWIRYTKYKQRTKALWGNKYHIDIYESGILKTRIDENDEFAPNQPIETPEDTFRINDTPIYEKTVWTPLDDFFKMIQTQTRLYVIAGEKNIVILPKKHVPLEIYEAFLELDIAIQKGENL